MPVEIKYVNHLNETLVFGRESGVYINQESLRDYLWEHDLVHQNINGFKRKFRTQDITIDIHKPSVEAANILKNNTFEIFEKDVLAMKKGKFWIGGYYFSCYIIGTINRNPIRRDDYIQKTVNIISDSPVWVKETPYNFYVHQDIEGDRTYPYSYPYGYSNNLNSQRILNDHFTKSNFKIVIYGAVSNPTIYINGHPYTVNTEVLEGEYLTISSLDKTVIKTKNNGEQVNEFNKRSKGYSVFEKIKQGSNTVSYNGTFDFEVILFEERSEPKWT